jgi:hypothetical protein
LIVTAAVVWGTKTWHTPRVVPLSRISAATRAVISIISHRDRVSIVRDVIVSSWLNPPHPNPDPILAIFGRSGNRNLQLPCRHGRSRRWA